MAAGSNPIATFQKDPDAVLDYAIDWSRWLGDDVISSVTWTVPAGIIRQTDVFSSALAVIWLSGGTAGTSYSIVCHITTPAGRQEDRTIKIAVVER